MFEIVHAHLSDRMTTTLPSLTALGGDDVIEPEPIEPEPRVRDDASVLIRGRHHPTSGRRTRDTFRKRRGGYSEMGPAPGWRCPLAATKDPTNALDMDDCAHHRHVSDYVGPPLSEKDPSWGCSKTLGALLGMWPRRA